MNEEIINKILSDIRHYVFMGQYEKVDKLIKTLELYIKIKEQYDENN